MCNIGVTCGTLVSFPFKVITTRQQSSGMGMVSTCKDIIRTKGVGGFFSGFGVNYVKALPAGVIGMWIANMSFDSIFGGIESNTK